MKYQKLHYIPGMERAIRVTVPTISESGAYELGDTGGESRFIVMRYPGATPESVTERAAEIFAMEAMGADPAVPVEALVALDADLESRGPAVSMDGADHAASCACPDCVAVFEPGAARAPESPAEPSEESPGVDTPDDSPVLAQAILAREGLDFEVFTEPVYVDRTPTAPEAELDFAQVQIAQAFTRADTDEVLSVQGMAATVVQNRDALSLLDPAAEAGQIEYTGAFSSYARLPGEAWYESGHQVALTFELTSNGRRWRAGGMVTTSHDGSTAIRAVASVRVAGVTIYAANPWSRKHTRNIGRRLSMGVQAMGAVTQSAQDLLAMVERVADCTVAPSRILDVLVDKFAGPEDPTLKPKDQEKLAAKREKLRGELAERAAAFADDAELGRLRYVLAAGAVTKRRNPGSHIFGTQRQRVTEALVLVSRLAS